MQKFLFEFTSNVVMYDPLNRKIPTEIQMENNGITEPWTTKREDLIDKIKNMKGTPGELLNVPLSNDLHKKLMDMIDKGNEVCINVANEYI